MTGKRNGLLSIIMIIMTVLFWLNKSWLISEKPETLLDLEDELIELNEQLISAQILANKLDQVYSLFDENLALSKTDSLADNASLPFLTNLMEMMNEQGIALLNFKPKPTVEKEQYVSVPYEIIMKCSFDELGKFLAELERSPRLVTINEFHIKNGIERIKGNIREEDLLKQIVEINLSTLTLVKSKTKIIS